MFDYKYEMHLHTFPCSKCARTTMEEMVRKAAEVGMAGFAVTNHFYHGNSGLDRSLGWEYFVGEYARDWEKGAKLGKEYGIDVFFGIEESYRRGKEVLIYGVSPEAFLKTPGFIDMTIDEISGFVHENGGWLAYAHPFRVRDYIPDPDEEPDPRLVDGVEVYNRGNDPERNLPALAFAEKYGLTAIAGGDLHKPDNLGTTGLAFEKRLLNVQDMINELKAGNFRRIEEGKIIL